MKEQRSGQLAQRMRMARRVADTLLPLEGNLTVTASATSEVLAGWSADSLPLKADFIIAALDLMIQLSLLVGRDADALTEPATLQAANMLLWTYPQSAACVLVVDDHELTSRIVEWGDNVIEEPRSTVTSLVLKQGPLREIIVAYLRTIDLRWPEPSSVMYSRELVFDEIAEQSARSSLIERQETKRSPIPERAQARASLSGEDAQWAARLALAIANNERVDLKGKLGSSEAIGDVS